MSQREELICAVCGHATFIMHRGKLHCRKFGAGRTDVVTTSERLHQLESALAPKSRRGAGG
jgi:hypothetical protein